MGREGWEPQFQNGQLSEDRDSSGLSTTPPPLPQSSQHSAQDTAAPTEFHTKNTLQDAPTYLPLKENKNTNDRGLCIA